MHTSLMNLRIYRSPEAGEGGGMPAGSVTGDSQSVPEPVQAQPAAAPEYLSKADFDAFRSEISGHLSRLTPKQEAAQAKQEAPGAPTKPKLSDFDFQKDPDAADKYQEAYYKFLRHGEKTADAQELATKSAQERQEKTMKGHQARVTEYKKENPSFEDDIKKAGSLTGEKEVTDAIFSHKESPAIIHHIAKNKALLDELNQLALSGEDREVQFRIGEIAADIRSERKLAEANAEAAGTKVPRQNFSKGSKGANHEPTMEERYTRFRS